MEEASVGLEDDAYSRVMTEIEAEHRGRMAEARGYSDENLAHRRALAGSVRTAAE